MRILMVSMFSIHFFRWVEQLKESTHEVFWIDVYDSNTKIESIDFVEQIVGWRNRWDYPGRHYLKERMPIIYQMINKINQRDLNSFVEKKVKEIRPDIVHSFVLQSSTYSILSVMKKYSSIKWVYSAWGNDLFYRKNFEDDLFNIKQTLVELDYMFADCTRDYHLAKLLGFNGEYLGTFPTGGGYNIGEYKIFAIPQKDRRTIIIKGYDGKLGRCNKILEALLDLKEFLIDYNIIIFGANQNVIKFFKEKGFDSWNNIKIVKHVSHQKVLELMGKSLIYVGNSISDGMPNTLLEAIIMDCFPIQSNPGGATEEIIRHKHNGLLIEKPEDSKEIAELILQALQNLQMIREGIEYNKKFIKPKLERKRVKEKVENKYQFIERNL